MAAWRILTSYELLYSWISGIEYFADQLFLRVEESQGGIELHATPETINQIFLDLAQSQDPDAIIAQFLKSTRLKQLLSLPANYQPDPARTQGLSEQNLYLIEIQYAHEKQVSLVCFSPDQYEQLAQLTHSDITLYKVGEFLQMCGTQLQVCELVASSLSIADQVLPVLDAVDEAPSGRNLIALSRQAGSTNQSPEAKASGAAEERSQQHLVTQLRGWLLPTSHRIGSQTDGVQILLFMLSSAILTYILRGKVENLTSRELANPTELALGANELEQFRHLLQMPWAILSGRPFQTNQPETASTQNFADSQLVGVAAKPFTATPTQPLGELQLPADRGPLQTGGTHTHPSPKRSSDLIQLQLRDPERTEPNPPGTTGESRPLKSLQPDQQENPIKTIQQPINSVPAPPDPPQTDPPRQDEPPILPAPAPPDDSNQPDPPAPLPPDPVTPIPFPVPPEFDQPVAPVFYLDETQWKEQPVLPPFGTDRTDDVEPGSVDWTERPSVPAPELEAPGRSGENRPGGDQSSPDNPIPIPIDEAADPDDLPSPGANPIERPEDALNPDSPTAPADRPVDDPADRTPAAPIGKSPVTLDNPSGKTLLPVALGSQVIIENFGGVGQGIRPSSAVINQVDTLQLAGADLTAENMLLNQQGTDLVMQFEVEDSPQILFKNFALDQLDNLTVETEASVTIGNVLFEGETEIADAFDVVNAELNVQQVLRPNTVTFLNAFDNITTGYRNSAASNDVINGMAGDDLLSGLAGDDLLRGGEGNDQLDGGAGDDVLNGGAGDDILQDFAGNNQMTGGRGRDQFILRPGAGTVTICDFNLGEDSLRLMQHSGSLSAQIRGQNTVLLFNDQPFATLQNVQTDLSNLLGR